MELAYTHKIVKSGDVIEIYRYHKEQIKKITETENEEIKKSETRLKQKKEDQMFLKKENEFYQRKQRTIFRTKTKLKRLINANLSDNHKLKDKFISLDFADYVNREEVISRFKLFNKRLRYQYSDYDYQYIAIIERGGNGTQRLHLHCLFFGLPFIPVTDFQKIWKYGNVDMQAIDEYNELASYVLKYLEKTLEDGSYIEKGQKFYLASMGLKRPEENFFEKEAAEQFIEEHSKNKEVIFETIFQDEFKGVVQYTKLRKPHKKDDELRKYVHHYDDDLLADEDYEYEEYLKTQK